MKRNMAVVATITFLTVIVITLQGCVSIKSTPYPKDWPAVMAMPCEEVAGRYANTSESVPEQSAVGSLFSLAMLSGVANRADETITVSFPDPHTLEVSGKVDSRSFHENKSEFRCRDGKIQMFHSSAHIEKEGWGPGRIAKTVTMSKASDGTLIVNDEESTLALLGWGLPYYQDISRWYRFKPAE